MCGSKPDQICHSTNMHCLGKLSTTICRKRCNALKKYIKLTLPFFQVGPFSIESLSLLTTFNKNNYDTSLKYYEEQIKDTKKELDVNNDKLNFERENVKKYEITIKEEIINDLVDDIPNNNDSDDFIDNIPKNNDSDDFTNIFDKIEVKQKKKYSYTKSLCKKTMKCSRASYNSGIDSHIESVQLKIEYIKDIISKGKNRTNDSILTRMFTAMEQIINTMNSDMKEDETNVS